MGSRPNGSNIEKTRARGSSKRVDDVSPFQVANDFSNLVGMEKKQFEVNLTRGLAYRHGSDWNDDNARYIKAILRDFKVTVRIGSIERELIFGLSVVDARRTNHHCQFQSNDCCTHVLSRLCLQGATELSSQPLSRCPS